MNYKEYLQSEHWIEFRKSIYKDRKYCQNCSSNKKLNIHHKNYQCLGKETSEDVLVLCNTCHFRFHKKPKWEKRMKNRESLDFVKVEVKKKNPIYNDTGIFRKCDRCGKEHSVFYKIIKDGRKWLGMACPESKPRVKYLPFEEGLDIPTLGKL